MLSGILPYLALAFGLLGYLALPRLHLVTSDADVQGAVHLALPLSLLVLGGCIGATELVARRHRRVAMAALLVVVQGLVTLRIVEVGLVRAFGFGFNNLFMAHAGIEAMRVALADYGRGVVLGLGLLGVATGPLVAGIRRVPWGRGEHGGAVAASAVVLAVTGLAAVGPEARRELAVFSFAHAVRDEGGERFAGVLDITEPEAAVLEQLGIRLEEGLRHPVLGRVPERRPNLIVVLLESFQANFTQAGGSPFPGLTPNLDAALARMTWVSRAHAPVTPTISAMTSILCGALPPRRPRFGEGRAYRSLRCLPDLLREAGYHQIYMGAALTSFTHKDVFLSQHSYDEIYGHEDWRANEVYRTRRRNTWGIHDPDLVHEALARIEALGRRQPFHLTLLTINSHKPGYRSRECPVYRRGNAYLNGIHCTDFAMKRLLEGLDRLRLWDDTVVVLIGDHMAFPIPRTIRDLGEEVVGRYFGDVFMAIHSPVRALPPRIDTSTWSPDVAPTILDLMGFELAVPFQLGRSLLGERRRLQRLVGPETELIDGTLHPARREPLASERCDARGLSAVRFSDLDGPLEPCERFRLVSRVDRWLRADEAIGRPPHPALPALPPRSSPATAARADPP